MRSREQLLLEDAAGGRIPAETIPWLPAGSILV